VIIARTDARSVECMDAALERASAYVCAGADVVFVEAPQSIDEISQLPRAIAAPLLINMFSGGSTPPVGTHDLEKFGYKIVIFPSHLQRAAIRAMERAAALLQSSDASAAGDDELMVSFAERDELVRLSRFQELEKRFLVGGS
jgi:2-methylisocitrate lyase-like PEP mutase family enzyme